MVKYRWATGIKLRVSLGVSMNHEKSTITSLEEKRANFSAVRTFIRFALVCFCLFFIPLHVWEGLWLVIVALPGLLPFFFQCGVFSALICSSSLLPLMPWKGFAPWLWRFLCIFTYIFLLSSKYTLPILRMIGSKYLEVKSCPLRHRLNTEVC